MADKLEEMFRLREGFMRHLQEVKGNVPSWPAELSKKDVQLFIKDVIFHSQEELFEALRELKNAKSHRQTDVPEFDRDHFLEEMVDSYNLFLEALVLVGITPDEFFKAYVAKDRVIHQRLTDGY